MKSTPLLLFGKQETRSLFNLRDKERHVWSIVYEGKCNRGKNYVSETGRNVIINGMNIVT